MAVPEADRLARGELKHPDLAALVARERDVAGALELSEEVALLVVAEGVHPHQVGPAHAEGFHRPPVDLDLVFLVEHQAVRREDLLAVLQRHEHRGGNPSHRIRFHARSYSWVSPSTARA
ncbi:MAG: hypothetical protein L3J77_03360 [Thermoplasmata archaeon]|nr:hypothetical protein [Thermoplasmata archaeon]